MLQHTGSYVAPIVTVRTATLLAEITADSNGSLLEELTDNLFGAIPGVQRYAHDRISVSNEKIDLACSNTRAEDGLARFGSDLLVECKSQGDQCRPGCQLVCDQLRRRQNLGVLIALSECPAGERDIRGLVKPRSKGVRGKASRSWCW